MKRANQLQPLSRQHHLGLHIGRHAKECADESQEVTKHWQALSSYMSDMKSHFDIEDNIIASALLTYRDTQPEVASVLDKLEQQHKQLHKLIADIQITQKTTADVPTVAQVRQLANALYDHVRFEERELFPIVETYLTTEELNAIYAASPDDIKHLEEQR